MFPLVEPTRTSGPINADTANVLTQRTPISSGISSIMYVGNMNAMLLKLTPYLSF